MSVNLLWYETFVESKKTMWLGGLSEKWSVHEVELRSRLRRWKKAQVNLLGEENPRWGRGGVVIVEERPRRTFSKRQATEDSLRTKLRMTRLNDKSRRPFLSQSSTHRHFQQLSCDSPTDRDCAA